MGLEADLRPLKVVYVGNVVNHNVGWSMVRHWRDDGHAEVRVIQDRDFLAGIETSALGRAHRLLSLGRGWPSAVRRYNSAVKAAVLAGPADVVHVDKGYYLLNTTLRDVRARSERTVLINYSLDDWFSLNRKVVGPYLHSTIPLYHHIFASKRYNVAELLAAGACSVSFLPCGYDPLIHRRTEDEGAAGYDVVFVGTYEPTRAEMLEALVSRLRPDCTVRVFGNGWQKVSRSSPLRKAIAQRPLLYPERPKVLCSSKIHLNFLRRANRDTFTDRSFELPATGCFMLAERSDEHLALFREGTDAEFFDGVDELIAKVEHYLADDVARMRIAVSGFRCVVSGKHTYYDRFSEIAARVGELVKTVGAEV